MARRRYQRGFVYLNGEMWYGRYRDDVIQSSGETVRVRRNVSLGTKREYPTKRLAERRMEQILGRVNAPEYRPGRVATVGDFAERWKIEIVSQWKPSARKAAESHLRSHIIPFLGKMRMENLGVENQQMLVTRLSDGHSRKTVQNVMGTLSSMLNAAKDWGYITEGVTFGKLKLPDRGFRKEVRCFTADEAHRIIEAAAEPWKLMFAIAAYTGLRAGEILGLRAEDVDLERKVIHVRQTAWYGRIQTAKTRGSESTVPVPESLCVMLRRELPCSLGLVFRNRVGRPYTAEKVVQKRLWPILDGLKIPRAGFHAFRHMHATVLLESGVSPQLVQRQMRHASSRTTMEHYAHITGDAQREAVERVSKYIN